MRSPAAVAPLVLAALAACAPSAASDASERPPTPTIAFTATADRLVAPAVAEAGYATLAFANRSDSLMAHALVRLRDGVSPDSGLRAVRIVQGLEPGDRTAALAAIDAYYGGAVFVAPAQTKAVGVSLPPGRYVAYADVVDDDEPRVHDGYLAPLEVRAAPRAASQSPASPAPPAPDHVVRMVDFGFEGPASVRAGRSRWRLENAGKAVHLAFIARLLPGRTYEEAKRWVLRPEGPPPIEATPNTLGVHAISAGLFNDVELDLARGEYVLVCVIEGHHAMGMVQPLRVTD